MPLKHRVLVHDCIKQELVIFISVGWFGEFYKLRFEIHLSTILKHWSTTCKKTYCASVTNMR
jgi:hypothetical protein